MHSSWVAVSFATGLAWIGALVAARLQHSAARFVRPLVYISLLFFALIAIFDILPESKQALSWPVFVVAVAFGYGIFWAIGRYVAPVCPSCAMRQLEHDHDHHHSHGRGLVILAAVLAVHCFVDGLGVSAASTVQESFGLRVFAAIAVHKFPEGFALTLVLMAGSRSEWQAFWWTFAIETATLLGAFAGISWAEPSQFWLALVLANIGGTFLYLSVSGLGDALSSDTRPVIMAEIDRGTKMTS
jgi:zinc transporter ZupT